MTSNKQHAYNSEKTSVRINYCRWPVASLLSAVAITAFGADVLSGAGTTATAITDPAPAAAVMAPPVESATPAQVQTLAPAKSAPQDVMLVLDNSGSMHKIDPDFLLRNAVGKIIPTLGTDVRLGLVVYDDAAQIGVPLTNATEGNRNEFQAGLSRLNYRGRYTNTAAGIERAIYELKSHGRAEAVPSIVLLTDGVIDTGDRARSDSSAKWLRDELAADAAQHKIALYTVAFGSQADMQLLHILAEKTGGDYVRAEVAAEIASAFERVFGAISGRAARAVAAESNPAAAEAEVNTLAPDSTVKASSTEPVPPSASEPSLHDTASAVTQPIESVKTQESAPSEDRTVADPAHQFGWPKEFSYRWLLGIGLALAILEVFLYARRRHNAVRRRAESRASAHVVPAATRIPEAFLQDMTGLRNYETFRLDKPWTLIGRQAVEHSEAASELVLDHVTIGRQHASIEYRDQGFWLTDRRSRNGTFVNGEPVSDTVLLKHGDLVRFHDFEFRFTLGCLSDSDETMVAGVLPDWATVGAMASTATAMALASGGQAAPAAATASLAGSIAPEREEDTPPAVNASESKEWFDDITLPTDDAVKKALDKYFEATTSF